jgi:hypothetical protein
MAAAVEKAAAGIRLVAAMSPAKVPLKAFALVAEQRPLRSVTAGSIRLVIAGSMYILAFLPSRFALHHDLVGSSGACVMTFAYRVDRWTDDGNSILDYVAAVADFAVARAAYRAACRRWPEARITLRQAARVVERNWSTSEAAN